MDASAYFHDGSTETLEDSRYNDQPELELTPADPAKILILFLKKQGAPVTVPAT